MVTLIERRLVQLVPILFGVTLVSFVIVNILPGNVADAILGDQATPQSIRVLDHQLGLNHSLTYRYWHWLSSAFHGNLGTSLLSSQSVSSVIVQRAPVSLELGALAILLALIFAIPTAALAGRRPGGWVDRVTTVVSAAAISTPGFVLALLLTLLFAVKVHLVNPVGFTPFSANPWRNLQSLALPAITVAAFPYALYLRVLRGDIERQLGSEAYVETARAKGLSESRVLVFHVIPNAAFGLLTVVALNIGTVIGGAVIVEQIFSIPGMGQTLVQGIYNRDSPVVQGVVVCLAICVVLANLAADLLYIVLDPRLRHGS